MIRSKLLQIAGNVSRWLIGAVFILSSITKMVAVRRFQDEVTFYLDVYFGGVLREYAMTICIALCVLELTIGVLAFFHITKTIAMVSATILLTFFVYLTGENYLNPSIMGSYESCGCFGELIHFTPLTSFLKSVILWLISGWCLYFDITENDGSIICRAFDD